MPLNEPGWWYGGPTDVPWQALALSPLSTLYGWVAGRRMARQDGVTAPLPVICVGNFTAGGTGKTPFVCWLIDTLKQRNQKPVVLTRGFGGRLVGPVWVDRDHHLAEDVGDEPLLVAQHAPVVVARDRALGVQAISQASQDNDIIIMDDGLQNPSVVKDLAIAVVDGKRGFGNGWVMPAGPLRAALRIQAPRVGAVVMNQGSGPDTSTSMSKSIMRRLRSEGFEGPAITATVSVALQTTSLENARVLAYAGIGNPERFFETVRALGADLAQRRVFADHHQVNLREARELLQLAKDQDLTLVTTEKDWVRLPSDDTAIGVLKAASRVVPIVMEISDQGRDEIDALIDTVCAKNA